MDEEKIYHTWSFIRDLPLWFTIPVLICVILLIVAFILYIFWFNHPEKIPKKENIEKPRLKAKTLFDYYKTDFTVMQLEKQILTITETKEQIKTKLLMDFDNASMYIAVYIPNHQKTNDIILSLISEHKKILEFRNVVAVESFYPGEQPTELKDISFTGRIFVYHEYPLFNSDIMEIKQLYKANGLNIQLRGHKYAIAKSNVKKQ